MLVPASDEKRTCDYDGERCGENALRVEVVFNESGTTTLGIIAAMDLCEEHKRLLHNHLHLATTKFLARRRKTRQPREKAVAQETPDA